MQAETTCIKCRFYNDTLKCEAFPNGIPDDILNGEFNHIKKHPKQKNDIVFKAKK